MATILDVVDNYLTVRGNPAVDRMSGRDLWQLGDVVREFAATKM